MLEPLPRPFEFLPFATVWHWQTELIELAYADSWLIEHMPNIESTKQELVLYYSEYTCCDVYYLQVIILLFMHVLLTYWHMVYVYWELLTNF